MQPEVLIKLVNSLSKAEKRAFKLTCKKQTGNKNYVQLFDTIESYGYGDPKGLAKKYEKTFGSASFHSGLNYLGQNIIDSLISSKIRKNKSFKLLYGLLELQILKERNLHDEAHNLVLKLKKEAEHQEELAILYILKKEELEYHSNNSFKGLSENTLIQFQVSTRELLRELRNTHEHSALYESLKYRFKEQAKKADLKDKSMDDLVLSELSIVNARVKHNLESLKLHLLFQSFFFIQIRDYKSALKTFNDLNRLFENHIDKLNHPPLDYFSMLDGILDSLRSIKRFDEMGYYINKLKLLSGREFPEHFTYLVKKTALVYELVSLIGNNKDGEAMDHVVSQNSEIWSAYSLTDPEKQSELQFYTALTYFRNKKFKKAVKHINQVTLIKSEKQLSTIYRVCKLFNLVLHYEEGDFEFLDYEIRSYKRSFKGLQKMWATEKMILNAIVINPKLNSFAKNHQIWNRKLYPLENIINNSNTEVQMSKYFDFPGWARDAFSIPRNEEVY